MFKTNEMKYERCLNTSQHKVNANICEQNVETRTAQILNFVLHNYAKFLIWKTENIRMSKFNLFTISFSL
jgi:hypothetical protein